MQLQLKREEASSLASQAAEDAKQQVTSTTATQAQLEAQYEGMMEQVCVWVGWLGY